MAPTREVGWKQLCAIAAHQLEARGPFPVWRTETDPDWFEWAERIKRRLVRLRLHYPDPPQVLTKAMEACHRAWLKREGLWEPPRSAEERRRRRVTTRHRRRHPSEPPNVDPPWPRRRQSTAGVATWTAIGTVSKALATPTSDA